MYTQNIPNAVNKLLSPASPRLDVRALDDPKLPVCNLLRNKGIRIEDMHSLMPEKAIYNLGE